MKTTIVRKDETGEIKAKVASTKDTVRLLREMAKDLSLGHCTIEGTILVQPARGEPYQLCFSDDAAVSK